MASGLCLSYPYQWVGILCCGDLSGIDSLLADWFSGNQGGHNQSNIQFEVRVDKSGGAIKLSLASNSPSIQIPKDLNTKADIQLRIYDLAGNVRYSRLSQGLSSYAESLSLSDLPNGVYSVVVTQGVESQVNHFIISR